MKIHDSFQDKFRDGDKKVKVFVTIDDEKNIKEISFENRRLEMPGIQQTTWISKNQAKKLDQFPRPPMTGKLLAGNFSIRIYAF